MSTGVVMRGREEERGNKRKKNLPSGLCSIPRVQSLLGCASLDSSNLVSASGLFDLVAPITIAACVTLRMMKTGLGGEGAGRNGSKYIFQDWQN